MPGDFTQIDLATDDVMILDTWDQVPPLSKKIQLTVTAFLFSQFPNESFSPQIFVWIGNDANEAEKIGSPKIGEKSRNIRNKKNLQLMNKLSFSIQPKIT